MFDQSTGVLLDSEAAPKGCRVGARNQSLSPPFFFILIFQFDMLLSFTFNLGGCAYSALNCAGR